MASFGESGEFDIEPDGRNDQGSHPTRDLTLDGALRAGRSRTPVKRRLALSTGEVIPGTPYRVRRWLGDGGMGVVFEAEHIHIERRVAVKLLHPHNSGKEWVSRAFRNEARASARIGSPNIVDILDFKELEDGRLLIAMEFLDGITLREVAKLSTPQGPRLVGIARQVCKGLLAAHEAGIVHRDVKPENIMLVEREGRHDFVKLVDFGVAQFLHDEGTERAVGTAQYMAPETVLGGGDERADIYAMGCLLYELACGEPVFDGTDPNDIVARHQAETSPPPSARAPERMIPPSVDALVMRCLHKDPDDRHQTIAEVEAALCELQIEQGWLTPWDDLKAPAVGEARRERIVAGLARLRDERRRRAWWPRLMLVALVLLIGVAAVALWPRRESSAARTTEIDALVASARASAGRFYFVYPPYDDPQGATAYREVLALEALDEDSALEHATMLRNEFAETLVRLGDRYWDYQGARPFAYEYYAGALMFVDDEHARRRVDLSLVTLERLRRKAADMDFTEHELLASEALAALAETEPQRRDERLAQLQSEPISVTVAHAIDEVLEHQRRQAPVAVEEPTLPEPTELVSTTAVDVEPSALETSSGEAPEEETSGKPSDARRRPAEARDLASQAEQALLDGDVEQAQGLFHRALAADRLNLRALDGLAAAAFAKAHYAQSVKFLERATRLDPSPSRRWIALGDAYFKTLRYDDARAAYQRAMDQGSSSASGRLEKLDRKLGSPDAPSEPPPSD